MARQVFGTQAILKLSRGICRLVDRFGTVILGRQTTAEFAAAVAALVAACKALDAVDDYVAVIDRSSGGTGINDEDIPTGPGTIPNEREDAPEA